MTSLTKQKIFEKLESFREYFGYLSQLRKESGSKKTFTSDFHLFGNTERYLQLSVQVILDIVHLLIIDLNLKRPEDNYEAIAMLYEKKIVSERLADKLRKMVGLRNILVHEYGKIDRARIYQILATQLEDLKEFQKQIISYLKNK